MYQEDILCEQNDFIFGAHLSLAVPPLYPLMLYAKFQNFRPSGSGEDFLKVLPPYMGMAAILVM